MKRWKLSTLIFCIILILQGSISIMAQSVKSEAVTRQTFIQLMGTMDKANVLEDDLQMRPQDKMTREEAASIIVQVLGYEGIAKGYEKSTMFTDVPSNKGAVHIIAELGIMNGVGGGQFSPKGNITQQQAETIMNKITTKLDTQTKWLNGFYALSSSSQMNMIPKLDAVSFGWAQVQYDEVTKEIGVNTSSAYGNDFSIPEEFDIPVDLASHNGVETYLMVYLEDKAIYMDESGKKVMLSEALLTSGPMMKAVIDQIVSLSSGMTNAGVTRSFDGVTIDFENFYNSETKEVYNQFLRELNRELDKVNKKLNVAVHPNTYFKGYDYKGIGEVADKVILMAHDYAPKTLTQSEQERGVTVTPQTPVNQIYEALKAITDPKTGVPDKEKIVLQISFASTQWQMKDGKVLNNKPYTPTYDKIYQRLIHKDTEIFYDRIYQNPYATYTQDGIKNVIWYENESSIQAKVDLAKLFGIYNISFWRIGTVPNYQDIAEKKVELDVSSLLLYESLLE
ncbi:MAG: glycosyl hydrolase family 18 protein [Cellulosilyticaceae bacterium]